ncbi:MAG TPA: PilT/PilU family type 4a pilus ATPase [Planctomycetota bacterium]|nr:PilT/PilU family type 4a pilus ATPase [Planctomycetota bacterium]
MPEASATTDTKEIHKLFRLMGRYGASDLHLKANAPPIFRIRGDLRNLDLPPLSDTQVRRLVYEILTEEQIRTLEQIGDVDLAYSVDEKTRLRINTYHQRGYLSLAARLVNFRIPTFEELHLPPATMEQVAALDQGFVIVAGVTGSGKSTTLAAMVEYINTTRRVHIVTIEDPIEYIYADRRSVINQREVGIDVPSFRDALRYVVRQDPDVILLGEMRDMETVQAGITAAETGHLVFGTLHTSTVPQTFSRLLEFFDTDRHKQVRLTLQFNLKAIICQKLLPSIKPGISRIPALEIMITNPPIAKLIELGDDVRILDVVKQARSEGMIDFNHSLYDLIKEGFVDEKVALETSTNPQGLRGMLEGVFITEGALAGGVRRTGE